jgi:Ca-activated chloride channel family protein
MEGEKLAQAKAGLIDVLQRLNPEDRFNIVAFSSQTRSYAPTPAPVAEAASAIDWIEELEALGGTNIYLALSEALAQVERERATTVVFLTDGLPTEGIVEEELLLAALEKEASEAAHIFPFGVGYDVNVLLLDALAQNHRGRPTYVEPDERIDEAVSTLYARMQSPLLTDVEVALERGDVDIYDVYPTELPDVYAGMQMIVTGRYTGRGADSLTISGRVNDRPVTYRYAVDFEDHDGAAFVPRLWATRKIGYLLTQIRLHGSQTEWIDAVVDLSLKYGIITPYTSFLIEEPQETLTQEGRDRAAEEMELEMQAVPTLSSGAGAVEDAKLREGLGGAEAPAGGGGYALDESEEGSAESGSARTRTIRYIGEKTFLCTAERCTDTDFVPDDMTPQEVTFLSDHYDELLVEDDIWARYFSLAEETIVVAEDGMAYRLLLGDPEAMPEVQSPAPDSTTSPTEDSGANTAPTVTPPTDTPSEDPTASVSEEDPEDARGGTGICAAASLLLVPLVVTVAKRRRR